VFKKTNKNKKQNVTKNLDFLPNVFENKRALRQSSPNPNNTVRHYFEKVGKKDVKNKDVNVRTRENKKSENKMCITRCAKHKCEKQKKREDLNTKM
jgi:hypothetical protein